MACVGIMRDSKKENVFKTVYFTPVYTPNEFLFPWMKLVRGIPINLITSPYQLTHSYFQVAE